jgi:hypothetical protein
MGQLDLTSCAAAFRLYTFAKAQRKLGIGREEVLEARTSINTHFQRIFVGPVCSI